MVYVSVVVTCARRTELCIYTITHDFKTHFCSEKFYDLHNLSVIISSKFDAELANQQFQRVKAAPILLGARLRTRFYNRVFYAVTGRIRLAMAPDRGPC